MVKWSNNEPVWEAGDVVDVIFRRQDGTTNGQYYRYTRDDTCWPGVQRGGWSDREDDDITAAFMKGDARVICEDVDMPYELAHPDPLPQTFWYAGHSDHSSGAAFADELSALRHAHSNMMDVVELRTWGDPL